MTSSTAESAGETLVKHEGQKEEEYDENEAEEVESEEQQYDIHNQTHHDLIHQIDDRKFVEPERNDHITEPHASTPVAFEGNAAGKLELAGEEDATGNKSLNAQSAYKIGTSRYEKQEVSGREIIEDVPDRKRLIEPVNYKLDATQIAESSSPLELTDRNKRPAIICSFFAKGWCIKGKSCRFLHIKDGLASEGKESVAIAAKQKCELPLDSSLGEDSAMDDGQILKQKNEVRGLLKDDHGFHQFHGHESWPISFGGQKMPSLSTPFQRCPSRIQKCLDSHTEYQASETSYSQHYSLKYSVTGSHNHPKTKQYAEYKTVSIGNWEPSIPFRPSHIITQRLLSREKLCDPMHDSAEQTHMRDKVSQCGQSAFGETYDVHAKVREKSVGILFPGYEFSTNFVSRSNFHNKEIQKDSSKIHCVNADSTAETQKISLLTENESSSNSIESRNILGADMVDDNDSEPCTDRQSHTTLPKIDCDRQDNGTDGDLKSEANVHKDSKELKIFHAALVNHVKELLKQPWHDGLLSKDVYKLIVKKTVDKVISTMEPHMIPDTSESIKQYFLMFNRKLVKLVEAYVNKYGKSVPG